MNRLQRKRVCSLGGGRGSDRRRGTVLFIVLIVVALLMLAAYRFSDSMGIERKASDLYGRRVQARAFADSGIAVTAAFLGQRELLTAETVAEQNLYHNPELFGGQLMLGTDDSLPKARGRFSVVSPVENDENAKTIRFGLANESGKLNINTVIQLAGKNVDTAILILKGIPGMTDEIAEAILDWVDEDDSTLYLLSEEELYADYTPKNGPFESLDELLLLPGVTPELLFGVDTNRNGIIDRDEEIAAADVAANVTVDDESSESGSGHPLGWSVFLTVHSRESNLRADGEAKIYLNEGMLTELYDSLLEEFSESGNGEEIAKFIVAYRLAGPDGEEEPLIGTGDNEITNRQATKVMAEQFAQSLFSGGGQGKEVTRAGMDLSGGAQFTMRSIYDLIDVEVRIEVDGVETTLQSPWTTKDMGDYLGDLFDRLTVNKNASFDGRINLNHARKEVLFAVIRGVAGVSEDDDWAESLAANIVSQKMIGSDGEPLVETIASHGTTGWLVMDELVSLEQMRQLDRYLTTRGDVYRAQVIGYFDDGSPVSRQEVIFDASEQPPRIIFQRDLTALGKGFTPSQLGSGAVE